MQIKILITFKKSDSFYNLADSIIACDNWFSTHKNVKVRVPFQGSGYLYANS